MKPFGKKQTIARLDGRSYLVTANEGQVALVVEVDDTVRPVGNEVRRPSVPYDDFEKVADWSGVVRNALLPPMGDV